MNMWSPRNKRRAVSEQEIATAIESSLTRETGSNAPGSLQDFCVRLAESAPRARAAFRSDLEDRVVAALRHIQDAKLAGGVSSKTQVISRRSGLPLRVGAAGALVVLLVAAIGGSVAAQYRSKRIAPVVVTAPPDVSRSSFMPPPAERRWMELNELRTRLGAPLLLPRQGTLPPGCTELERFFFDGPRVANVRYSCVTISLQAGQGVAMPLVPAGTVEDVLVNGQPAVYIDGAWMPSPDSQAAPTWTPGLQQLLLERDGLLVILAVLPGDPMVPQPDGTVSRVPNTVQLTKADLIHIAESLAPVP